jgi:hypothetical protein
MQYIESTQAGASDTSCELPFATTFVPTSMPHQADQDYTTNSWPLWSEFREGNKQLHPVWARNERRSRFELVKPDDVPRGCGGYGIPRRLCGPGLKVTCAIYLWTTVEGNGTTSLPQTHLSVQPKRVKLCERPCRFCRGSKTRGGRWRGRVGNGLTW